MELKVIKEERLASGRLESGGQSESTLFLCQVENVMIEEGLQDRSVPFIQRLKQAAPVVASGEERYISLSGQDLGAWGEPMQSLS